MKKTEEYTSQRVITDEIGVNSCGIETLFDKDKHVTRTRTDYTLMYVASGKATMITDKGKTDVNAGEAMLFLPGALQQYTFLANDKSINKWVHFGGKMCEKLGNIPARKITPLPHRHFEKCLDYLTDTYFMITDEREMICNGYMTVILSLILESIRSNEQNESKTHTKMTTALNYIHINTGKDINWDDVASLCCLSRDRFNHVFRKYTGYSPKEYHTKLKIELAKKLLTDSDVNSGECAAAIGCKDTNYFCRLFKKETGMTPSLYRITARKNGL